MLSIGEFARYAGVSVRMLRHYDALGLLAPTYVDPFTGYRHYSAGQLPRLNRLVALKELGFTLDQVGPILDADVGAEELRGMLTLRRAQITEQIDADQARLRAIEARLRLIESEGTMSDLEFVEKPLPALRLAQITDRVSEQAEIAGKVGPMFDRLVGALTAAGQSLSDPALAWYEPDGDEMRIAAALPTALPSVEGVEIDELPAVERAVTVIHRGAMATIDQTWQALGKYVESQGASPSGRAREVYLEMPMDDESAWVTELQQPVT
jgi:DNA-binding transcriptional MerR regulator/effector-binding domain-containing protein